MNRFMRLFDSKKDLVSGILMAIFAVLFLFTLQWVFVVLLVLVWAFNNPMVGKMDHRVRKR